MSSRESPRPALIVLAGLPGVGKSTVAAETAGLLGCAVIAVDEIEAALWRAGVERSQPTGLAAYLAAESLADQLLRQGRDVIVDAVNDAPEARRQWVDLAARTGADLRFAELVCEPGEHRRRLEGRSRDLPDELEPTWDDVTARAATLAHWSDERLRLEATDDIADNAWRIVAALVSA